MGCLRSGIALTFRNDPNCMDYPGNIPKDGKNDIYPELRADPHLQKYTQGRQQN